MAFLTSTFPLPFHDVPSPLEAVHLIARIEAQVCIFVNLPISMRTAPKMRAPMSNMYVIHNFS